MIDMMSKVAEWIGWAYIIICGGSVGVFVGINIIGVVGDWLIKGDEK